MGRKWYGMKRSNGLTGSDGGLRNTRDLKGKLVSNTHVKARPTTYDMQRDSHMHDTPTCQKASVSCQNISSSLMSCNANPVNMGVNKPKRDMVFSNPC